MQQPELSLNNDKRAYDMDADKNKKFARRIVSKLMDFHISQFVSTKILIQRSVERIDSDGIQA